MRVNDIEIDKVFVNKNYTTAFSMGKIKIWFNNLSFSDYVFLDKMSSDVYSDCGLDGILKSTKDYKKNLLFINNNDSEIYPSVNLYVGMFVCALEKDRCLLSYDKNYPIMWEGNESFLEKILNKEIRKQKINNLLHDN